MLKEQLITQVAYAFVPQASTKVSQEIEPGFTVTMLGGKGTADLIGAGLLKGNLANGLTPFPEQITAECRDAVFGATVDIVNEFFDMTEGTNMIVELTPVIQNQRRKCLQKIAELLN